MANDSRAPVWDSLLEGEGPPPRTDVPVSITDIVRYQGVSGDLHPAHHDLDFAKAHGYPRLLSLGMLHASQLAALATDWLGPENVRHMKVRFKDVVWVNDSLTYSGKVLHKFVESGERKVSVELLCVKKNGNPAVQMSAIFVVP